MATTGKDILEKVKKAATAVSDSADKLSKQATDSASIAMESINEVAKEAKATSERVAENAKKDVAVTTVLQFDGQDYQMKDLVAKCREDYKAKADKPLTEISIYVKPQENKIYYVANNGDFSDSIDM